MLPSTLVVKVEQPDDVRLELRVPKIDVVALGTGGGCMYVR